MILSCGLKEKKTNISMKYLSLNANQTKLIKYEFSLIMSMTNGSNEENIMQNKYLGENKDMKVFLSS